MNGNPPAAENGERSGVWPAEIFDALPAAVVLFEPGTARVLFANQVARTVADGVLAKPRSPEEYGVSYRCFDVAGEPVPLARMPGVRASRGETVQGQQVVWETPKGRHTFEASGMPVTSPDGDTVVVMTYLEVTEREAASLRERQAGEELGAILEGVADAITAQGPDGRLVYANPAAIQMLGYEDSAGLLAAPLPELMSRWEMYTPSGEEFPPQNLPGRRALAGEDPGAELVRFRHVGGGEMRWARVKARPVHDEDGSVRLAINLIEDITEIKAAEEASSFLAEASRVLAGSLDYEQTLATIARLAVPGVADWCAVDLVGPDDTTERVTVAHVDPAKLELAGELERRYPGDRNAATGVPNVLRTGQSELHAEISDDLLAAAARDAEHLELIRSIGMVSVMIVPMCLHDRVLGAITFVSAEAGRAFGDTDLRVAEDLALRAATAVENARLYQSRSNIAQVLQASLLPPHLPDVPGIEVAALFRPAGEGFDVGGDFYDLFAASEEHWFAVIGDVCGKGPEAAAVTALARYTIRAAASRRRSPAEILRWVNDAMLRQEAARFCTVAVVHIDRSGAEDDGSVRLRLALGGHPVPIVLRADGAVDAVGVPGTLLGLVERARAEDADAVLAAGDTLVLYTDGVTEAGAPDVWSAADLAAAAGRAAGLGAQEVIDHVVAEALGGRRTPPRDDIAMLALRAAG